MSQSPRLAPDYEPIPPRYHPTSRDNLFLRSLPTSVKQRRFARARAIAGAFPIRATLTIAMSAAEGLTILAGAIGFVLFLAWLAG